MKHAIMSVAVLLLIVATAPSVSARQDYEAERLSDGYQYQETRDLVRFVNDAAEVLRAYGEAAFDNFRIEGGRWRQGDTYIFVIDPRGKMLVHPDSSMEGRDELDLKDVNGKPIVHGLIEAATALDRSGGWYHYEWPTPGGLLPRWKSSYVRLVPAPSGELYVVGAGIYNDRMEKAFVVDQVKRAVDEIEKNGKAAFPVFHDRSGPFLVKNTYIFVLDNKGIELVNPAFPNLEGRDVADLQDTQGKRLNREMFKVIEAHGAGWVDYMWPKPGESVSTQKSAYVTRARLGGTWVMVGSGVYLANAAKANPTKEKMTAPELMSLVRDAAEVFEQRGEKAFPEFRKLGSKWFHDDTYFFVWTMEGTRYFHAADPTIEGIDVSRLKDVLGRPMGRMFLDTAASPSGEGWVHYMYPEPGDVFPTWKSSFVKRVMFPSGTPFLVGCGIYNMTMDKAFIEDVVNRAADLIADHGSRAFDNLRDKTGPFVFLDTYVFVESPDGVELVNPAQPSLEGKNLLALQDLRGTLLVRDEIAAAMKDGSAWIDGYWYKPGDNVPARKQTFVRKVQHGPETYIVGSGMYTP